jgi:hypothetical protein
VFTLADRVNSTAADLVIKRLKKEFPWQNT